MAKVPVFWKTAGGVIKSKLVDDSELTSICVDCGVDTTDRYQSLKADNNHRCTPCFKKTPEGKAIARAMGALWGEGGGK